MPPPWALVVLPVTVQLVSVAVPPDWLARPPPLVLAKLPLMVQSVIVSVPKLFTPPPMPVTEPPLIVSPQIAADVLALTQNTCCVLPPLTDSRLAPGPVIVVVAASPANVIAPLVRVIV